MASWLVPIALFWILSALYLGGDVSIQGGGGVRQISGLLLHFAAFLAVWAVARMLLVGVVGEIFSVVLAMILAVTLLPLLARLTFRAVGVRITSAETA